MLDSLDSSLKRSSGNIGVRWSKGMRSRISSTERPFTETTLETGKYFSFSLGGRIEAST